MRLTRPMLRLPVRFSAERLAEEIRALPPEAWVPHPQKFAGNEAVRLITAGGGDNDLLHGPMAPTKYLGACPYIMEIMAELGAVWGRSRLMGLGPGADVPRHVDIHYYWRTHFRIHVPIITNPGVLFDCDGETLHIPAGECWVLDTFRRHGVHNKGSEQRVHLVLDTVGGERLWDMIDAAQAGGSHGPPPRLVEPGTAIGAPLRFEQFNLPEIMSPWEMRGHFAFLEEQAVSHPRLGAVMARLDKLATAWGAVWAQFGPDEAGRDDYLALIDAARPKLEALGAGQILLRNGRAMGFVLDALVFANALASPHAAAPFARSRQPGPSRLAS